MPLADFTITVHFERQPRAARVVVYETLRALRAAATRYDNRTRNRSRRKRGDHADTCGVCHRFEHYTVGNGREDPEFDPLCAIVRLAEPYLGVGVVSHELAHAAVWMRELVEGEDKPLTCANDEQFCWVLGELVRQTINSLDERGVY